MNKEYTCEICGRKFDYNEIKKYAEDVIIKIDLYGLESCSYVDQQMYKGKVCPKCTQHA